MRENKLYCCYSVPLMNYLTQHNVEYELVALNKKTKCTMWIYLKNEKLDNLLKEWSQGCKN